MSTLRTRLTRAFPRLTVLVCLAAFVACALFGAYVAQRDDASADLTAEELPLDGDGDADDDLEPSLEDGLTALPLSLPLSLFWQHARPERPRQARGHDAPTLDRDPRPPSRA